MDRKLIASGLYEALELADRELRDRHADLFAKVDAIRARPEWQAFSDHSYVLGPDPSTCRIGWCAWCGDTFAASKKRGRWIECCGHGCAMALRRFRNRRPCPSS